jgi:hypothetical protein
MISDFKYCIKPDKNLIIWRYMDFDKLVSLLLTKSLFFCKSNLFPDPFEGSIPIKEEANRKRMIFNTTGSFNKEKKEEVANKSVESISKFQDKLRSCYTVNCWHINNSENELMWRLYLNDNKGVAIKTNVSNLVSSFSETKEEINISKVRYLNYEHDEWHDDIEYPVEDYNLFIPIVHKRIEFSSENELRLIYYNSEAAKYPNPYEYWNKEPIKEGKFISVKLEELIEEVICPPLCPDSHMNLIEQLIKEKGYKFPVTKSIMNSNPIY